MLPGRKMYFAQVNMGCHVESFPACLPETGRIRSTCPDGISADKREVYPHPLGNMGFHAVNLCNRRPLGSISDCTRSDDRNLTISGGEVRSGAVG